MNLMNNRSSAVPLRLWEMRGFSPLRLGLTPPDSIHKLIPKPGSVAQPPPAVEHEAATTERGCATRTFTIQSDYWVLGALLSVAGAAALWFFYRRNEILLSGDAVAHINIARRIFDSRTPGPSQLGTVWLPLPHLLTMPFIIVGRMWQSGIGGSVVSVISYVVAGLGLFRLLSRWSRVAAWMGTLIFAANPNLLYVQATALNEPLYLACFIWSTVFFVEASRSLRHGEVTASAWLEKGAMALIAGIFTRYDGWFLACLCWTAITPAAVQAMRSMPEVDSAALRKSVCKAILLTALGPTLWLAYNFGEKSNALDFANGPYSARAIAQRTTDEGAPPYPGERHAFTAGVYFAKAAQLNVAESTTAKLLFLIAVLASFVQATRRDWLPIVLLWSPLLFYALSIAYGSVPIFLPVWWPFSYYNVRYGLELLPAIAAGAGLSTLVLSKLWRSRRAMFLIPCLLSLLAISCYAAAWRAIPVCLREVRTNGHARLQLDRSVAKLLAALPRQSTILAYTGAHSGAFEMAGVPLRRTINEGTFVVWDGALNSPAKAADYIVAWDGDPVAFAVTAHSQHLTALANIQVEGQPRAVLYKSTH
jgi:hypothetical protein